MRAHEFITELTFYGSQCTDRCQGHRAGYEWAKKKGATQPPTGTHPSFAKGAAIAIQHRGQGLNPIGTGIRGDRGRYQQFNPQSGRL